MACAREPQGCRERVMSNGTKSSSPQPGWRGWVRNPQDFYGGLALVALALFAFWASSDLPGMRGFAFGPGTAPRLFAYGLMGVGFGVVLMGLFLDGPPEEPFAFSGPVGGAVLIVALIPITYYSVRIGHI